MEFVHEAADPAIGTEIGASTGASTGVAMDAWPSLPDAPPGHPCPLHKPAANSHARAVATFAMG